ncbi:creatininase [Sinanaerobacter chloroacetimidivorans]|uniref:Creatininase n=1 Tax=Sinanaerobacter chloroacetimidivorans TaxID=2818044 RepID=A0A8J7W382_9FIRM|nr:creatininase [Sinanaerobacter chloroacetimidivorans]MBR0599556.1 creatininase [Sinanaerobacter chloroacetimidivorans]
MTCKMQEMTWQDFDEIRKEGIVILPVGSTEQHGPHLPLSVDAIISEGLAVMIAEKVRGAVAPTICYGYKSAPLSGGGPFFPGTLDLNGLTLMNLVGDVLEELIRDQVKKILIVNGHYENEAFILEAVDLISRKYPDVKIVEASWWDQISQEVMDRVFDEVPFPGWALEHAAIAETSLTMFFRPDLVKFDRLIEDGVEEELTYQVYPAPKEIVPKSGLLATARTSSLEKGKWLAEDIAEFYKKIVLKEFNKS